MKSYIDNNLNTAKVNMIDLTKTNKEFKYYFLKKNLVVYLTIAETFLRNQRLITIWKDQKQDSTMENTAFRQFVLRRIISILRN